MNALPARLFLPDTEAKSCELNWTNDLLLVGSQSHTRLQVPVDAVTATLEGFDRNLLVLRWPEPAGNAELHIAHQRLPQAAVESLPPQLARQVDHIMRQHRARVQRQLGGWALLGAVFAMPMLLLLAFLGGNDLIAKHLLNRIPFSIDQEIGNLALQELQVDVKLERSGANADAVIAIGQALSPNARFEYRFFVDPSEAVNAYALPGGIVVINAGLIAATANAEALAGVIAHEIAHVQQRHGMQLLLKQLGLGMLWVFVTGDISGLTSMAAIQLLQLNFSRDAELDADREGLMLLQAAMVDPTPMVVFFNGDALAGSDGLPDWLLTHPASDARAAALATQIQQLPARRYAKLLPETSWPPAP